MHIYGWIWIHMMLWMQNSSIDFSPNVSSGDTDRQLIRPFLEGWLTVQSTWGFRDMNCWGYLKMYLWQHRHECTSIREHPCISWYLNQHFPGHWIGSEGSTEMACDRLTSPPLDLHVWGYTNDRVYECKVDIHEDIFCHIVDVAWYISDWGTLHCVICSVVNWARMCI
jgi:hypothetical protein